MTMGNGVPGTWTTDEERVRAIAVTDGEPRSARGIAAAAVVGGDRILEDTQRSRRERCGGEGRTERVHAVRSGPRRIIGASRVNESGSLLDW